MVSNVPGVSAREEQSVRVLYEDGNVADKYIVQRFTHAWARLLHQKQVSEINEVIERIKPENILEVAPGPARLAVELKGVRSGLMVDSSEPMLVTAKRRLSDAGLSHLWKVEKGNAFELDRLRRQFQFIFTFRFVRHFRAEDRARLYSLFSACLTGDGLLMFDVVNKGIRAKLDAQDGGKDPSELDVYDQTYSVESFREEMAKYGFNVIRLAPVVKHFFLQSWLTNRLAPRSPKLSTQLVFGLEMIPSREPLEWIALCQKSG